MMNVISNHRLAMELEQRGLLPKHCRLLEVSIPPGGALVLRYEVFVEPGDLAKFADALLAVAAVTTDE